MRNLLEIILFMLVLVFASNCSNKKPRVEFENGKVYLYNFRYSYGITGPTSVTTNSNEFDELIWDQLGAKDGVYDLIYVLEKKDSYGEVKVSEVNFGKINLSEIKKYRSFEDFKKGDGFLKILEK